MTSHELRAEAMSVRYGGAIALSKVSVVAPGGAVTAIVGPNGAGKSSLLLAIYGSVDSTGQVFVDNEEMTGLKSSARARQGVAIVPQGRQLFARLSVRDNLQVMAETLRLPSSAVEQALDRFPILRTRSGNLAGVLSGGEQQMLVVARALMSNPRVLLLDEMMTGLAPLIVQELAGTVRAVRSLITRGYVLIRGSIVAAEEGGGRDLDKAYQATLGVEIEQSIEIEEADEAAAAGQTR
jgi:branched-chain amino acid transport system ATP-binding protein